MVSVRLPHLLYALLMLIVGWITSPSLRHCPQMLPDIDILLPFSVRKQANIAKQRRGAVNKRIDASPGRAIQVKRIACSVEISKTEPRTS